MKTSSTRASRIGAAALLVVAATATASAPARAQQNDPALAETLFRQGKALLEAGDFAKACPKLAESQAIDPGTGTLLALAICHEREGKIATAWAEFTQVAVAAKREARPDRERAARDKVASLEPRLSRLTVVVQAGAAVDVTRDGVALGPAAWGTPSPIDPGPHVIQASAHGKKTWSETIKVGPRRDDVRVEVPALEDQAVPPPPVPDTPAPQGRPSEGAPAGQGGKRTIGFVVGGAGVVALGIGSYFGVRALSENGDATALCPSTCRNPRAVSLSSDARADATVANIVIGVGIVALAVSAYLVVTSYPSKQPSSGAMSALLPWVAHAASGHATW